MDRIKLYYNIVDTKPRVLISHFVRYLGFYVEDIIANDMENKTESLMDIYIISDAYVNENSVKLDIVDEKKTIMIYMDGWTIEDSQQMRSIQYIDQGDRQFLGELCHHMVSILSEQMDTTRRLIYSVNNLEMVLHFLIDSYIDNNILQMALFARCFYAQRPIFNTAYIKYLDFIRRLEELVNLFELGDLCEYMRLLACYELDMICKMNSYSLYFEPMELQEECEMLLKKYVDNEELHLLQADIDLQLNGIWNKAGNEYADIRLVDCAYAYMWQGNILLRYVRDRQSALQLYQEAIRKKPDYFMAWLQIGECFKQQSEYMYAIIAYQRVIEILADRYHEHVLSPMEITDLFMAVMQIAEINQFRLKNFTQANAYIELARGVRNEIKYDRYFKLVWNDEAAYSEYFPLICNELDIRLNKYEYNIKEEGEIYYEYN